MLQLDLVFILKWWFIFFLIGMTFTPFTSRVFKPFIDKGYIFSKIIGICFISYTTFVLGSLHILRFNTLNIYVIWLGFLFANLAIAIKNKKSNEINLKLFFFEEFLFFICLFFWALVRSYNPPIHDLEKFMDFGFINSILRSEYFPPRDMWLTPLSINYYYFGHLVTAVLTKISDIPSFISFNLMIAGIFAFCFSSSFSIGINLVNKIKTLSLKKLVLVGLIFAYLVSFSGNVQTIYSFFKSYQGSEFAPPFWTIIFSPQTFPNSYWYPNATRFIYRTIHEFPSYSFVVADLHGHVLDIPIVLTLIALSFILFLEKKNKSLIVLLISFFLSIAYMTNAWDGLIYLGLFINIFFLLEFIENKEKKYLRRFAFSLFKSIKYILLTLVLFFIFSFTFNKSFSPFASGIGLICSPDFLIKIGKIGPFIFEKGQCQHTPIWQFFILYGFFIYTFLAFLIFLRKKKLLITDYFVLLISLFSFLLIIIPEIFYLKDIYSSYFRANTMFKLSYQAFIMLSISSSYILIRIVSVIDEKSTIIEKLKTLFYLAFRLKISYSEKALLLFPHLPTLSTSYEHEAQREIKNTKTSIKFKLYSVIFLTGTIILFSFVSIYPYFAIPSGYGNLNKYQGLDGIKYLAEIKPSDYKAINFINQNIKGQPVILEAQGDSYTDYARISANTGLPTVLGWTVHEWLWRGSYSVPSARFDDIKNLYETSDLVSAKKIIKKYNISLIYIGKLEKEKYSVSEAKFLKLGKIIFANGETNIYKIY